MSDAEQVETKRCLQQVGSKVMKHCRRASTQLRNLSWAVPKPRLHLQYHCLPAVYLTPHLSGCLVIAFEGCWEGSTGQPRESSLQAFRPTDKVQGHGNITRQEEQQYYIQPVIELLGVHVPGTCDICVSRVANLRNPGQCEVLRQDGLNPGLPAFQLCTLGHGFPLPGLCGRVGRITPTSDHQGSRGKVKVKSF